MIFRHAFTLLLLCLLGTSAAAQDRTDEIWALVRQGQIEKALVLAEQYASEQPDDALAQHSLGRLLFMNGQHGEAADVLTRCLELGPEPAWALAWTHNVLGQALAQLGQKEDAEKHLRTAIELDATANCTNDARAALQALSGEDPWGKGFLHGKPLPEFAFHGVTGEIYTRESFLGSPLLFRFGPTW
jgi:tetratricopeptide (TPR) repeat protein